MTYTWPLLPPGAYVVSDRQVDRVGHTVWSAMNAGLVAEEHCLSCGAIMVPALESLAVKRGLLVLISSLDRYFRCSICGDIDGVVVLIAPTEAQSYWGDGPIGGHRVTHDDDGHYGKGTKLGSQAAHAADAQIAAAQWVGRSRKRSWKSRK